MIKKSDVLKITTASDQAAYEHFSTIIDDALKRYYDGTHAIAISIPTEMSTKVIKMINDQGGVRGSGRRLVREA